MFYPYVIDPYWITGDEGQYIAQFYAWIYPERFNDDLSTKYTLSYTPEGFKLIFYLLSPWFDLMSIARVGAVMLLLFFYFFCTLIGYKLAGKDGAVVSFLVSSHCYIIPSSVVGLSPRAFCFPLIAAFVYFYLQKRNGLMICILLLATFFYPPAFVIIVGVICFDVVVDPEKRFRFFKKEAFPLLVFCVLCFIFLVAFSNRVEVNGPLVSYEETLVMPEWHHFRSELGPGRFDAIPFKPFFSTILHFTQSGLHTSEPRFYHGWVHSYRWIALNMHFKDLMFWCYALLCFSIVVFNVRRSSWCLSIFLAGVTLYLFARILAFHLYIPDRYLTYSLPLFTIFLLPLAMSIVKEYGNKICSLLYIAFLLLPLPIFFLYPTGFKIQKCEINNEYIEVMNEIKKIPGDLLIAGWPRDMDHVTILTKQPFLASEETTHPFFKTTYGLQKQRIYDSLTILHSDDEAEVKRLVEKYKITHLLINKNLSLQKMDSPPLFEPLKSVFIEELAPKYRRISPFVYMGLDRSLVFENDQYQLLDVRKI